MYAMLNMNLTKTRERHIRLMRQTAAVLANVLKDVTTHEAATLRDGPEGWTILEVLCHLRDFDTIFYERARLMLEEDYPELPAYDHRTMAITRNYNSEEVQKALGELIVSRQRFVAFFEGLSDDQWERAGIHPERGHFTMTDAVMQVGLHEVNHIEQITRILANRRTGKAVG